MYLLSERTKKLLHYFFQGEDFQMRGTEIRLRRKATRYLPDAPRKWRLRCLRGARVGISGGRCYLFREMRQGALESERPNFGNVFQLVVKREEDRVNAGPWTLRLSFDLSLPFQHRRAIVVSRIVSQLNQRPRTVSLHTQTSQSTIRTIAENLQSRFNLPRYFRNSQFQ